jgi:hypothetical protein
MFFLASSAGGCQQAATSREKGNSNEKSVLTIVLAVATALALSQYAVLTKSSNGHTAKTSTAKTHREKPMYKHS